MSRIQKVFEVLKKQNKKALIPFITAGYPKVNITVPLMHALVKGGADIIELGIPFSDPMADGPVIQRASERALENHVNLPDVLRFVRDFRKENSNTPIVLMGYANPIERMGVENFVEKAYSSGVDGVLIVDYPLEESAHFVSLMRARDMDAIFLLAPTSSEERIKQTGKQATGYIYYVSLKGVTGSNNIDMSQLASNLSRIKKHIAIPVSVGFGIHDKNIARSVALLADGVVIGSKLIQVIENTNGIQTEQMAEKFISDMKAALNE